MCRRNNAAGVEDHDVGNNAKNQNDNPALDKSTPIVLAVEMAESMRVAQLKEALEERGSTKRGLEIVLVARLIEFIGNNVPLIWNMGTNENEEMAPSDNEFPAQAI